MASVRKLLASAFCASNENTNARQSVDLDFSVLVVEAPAEETGSGNDSSPRRRDEAEDGNTHTTARKSGALVEDDLPEVPELLRAYGKRSSGIAGLSELNSHGSICEPC